MPEPGLTSLTSTHIAVRLAEIRRKIDASALRAGRSPADIEVVVVTKGQPPAVVREAYAAGIRHFGENRVDELAGKVEALADLAGVTWDMVGHLQSRKVKDLPQQVAMVHSADRLKIADRLEAWASERGRPLDILLECNMSGEPTKAGWSLSRRADWERTLPDFEKISRFQNLKTLGLMTMAPEAAETAVVRPVFVALAELRRFVEARLGVAWPHLSMGMTDDFEI
ncbi:MAG TPA: YggS family pyridoxal phosphate-dependent enzyme, partial [Anaerolineales bacterium]|nr:YggS family pyridoxal phosphate-dependent enzyme [Anaerolineales bacterium]